MKISPIASLLLKLVAVVFICAFLHWTLRDLASEGVMYWVKYIVVLSGVLAAFYVVYVLFRLVLLKLHDWRYPNFSRELSQSEISYIESQQKELSAYVDSRNFGSKKYWLAAWVWFGLIGLSCFLIAQPYIYLYEKWSAITEHSDFGRLIDVHENVWTAMPLFMTGFISVILLATYIACLLSYVYRPFAEATTVGLTWEETSLGEKAKTLPQAVAKYVRYQKLDLNSHMQGEKLLAFIGRQRRAAMLKWAIGLAVLSLPLSFINQQNGIRFYQEGLTSHSLLTLSTQTLAYTDIDHIGITCLYDDAENETSEQYWYFEKDNITIGRMRFPNRYEKDFDELDEYLILQDVKFKILKYTFKAKSKNVESPFAYCASKLIEKRPEHRAWISKVLHLEEFGIEVK